MRRITIGRSVNNDYQLTDDSVSKEHAVIIISDDGTIRLRDLNSTNGTFLSYKGSFKRIVDEQFVQQNDTIRFGNVTKTVSEITQAQRKTVVNSVSPAAPSVPLGSTQSVRIGRGKDCQHIVSERFSDVSSHHAFLYRLPNGDVQIEDTASKNGTFVNGERVIKRVLKPGDIIRLGSQYQIDWTTLLPPQRPKKPSYVVWAASIAALLLIGIIGWKVWPRQTPDPVTPLTDSIAPPQPKQLQELKPEELYARYNKKVCLIYFTYGYEITIDGRQGNIHALLGAQPNQTIILTDTYDRRGRRVKALSTGTHQATATGFFISNDGKIATNLHVSRPWLFQDSAEERELIEQQIREMFTASGDVSYIALMPKVKVTGKIVEMGIIPNGLPFSTDNLVHCSEYRGHEDVENDVAVLITDTHSLPSSVDGYIDITNPEMIDEECVEGKSIFTIGFPTGDYLAKTPEGTMQNQIQNGSVTQTRGDFEFGHNAPTLGGASGSPIFNNKGQLIGVNHAGLSSSQGFNMGIKAKYLVNLLESNK